MNYNISYAVAGLIILCIILCHFLRQKNIMAWNSSQFLFFLIIGMLDVGFDLLSTMLEGVVGLHGPFLLELSLVCLYELQIILSYSMVNYFQTLCDQSKRNQNMILLPFRVGAILMVLAIMFNHWHGMFFTVTKNGEYIHGPLYFLMYAFAGVYTICEGVDTVLRHRRYGTRNVKIIWEYIFLVAMSVGIQAVRNDLMMISFGISIGIIVLFLTINNPYSKMDSITGLNDRAFFQEVFFYQRKHQKAIHCICVDVYDLRQINKVWGINGGNRVLRETARMLESINKHNIVVRINSNQFVLIARDLSDYEEAKKKVLQYIGARKVDADDRYKPTLRVCGVIDAHKLKNAGQYLAYNDYLLSVYPDITTSLMIQGDDQTLKGFVYQQEVEKYLDRAISEDLFEVAYQPVFSYKDGKFVSLEALSRLRHPSLGPISPELFLSIAQHNNKICQIGILQFRRICAFVNEHKTELVGIRNVKINLSPVELLDFSHVQELLEIIHEYKVDPSFFQFEITEQVATEYGDAVYTSTNLLKEHGIGLCLDDFGSGYSNISAVLKLPFDVIKMDRSLLMDICSNSDAALFYKSIVTVLQQMGFHVVSEGVEEEKELAKVVSWGVNLIQGYYYSKPLMPSDLLKKLSETQKT